jgi:hypothetical protein
MFAVARLHPAAEGHEILVGVDHGAFGRLRCPRVVPALIESYPSPAELIAPTYLWPRQSTAHSASLEASRPLPLTGRLEDRAARVG